jgi:hypothetical protein
MLLVLFFFVIEFFLLIGVVVFGLCVALPSSRRYALSAALWCACWGPCTIAFFLLAGLSVVARHAINPALGGSFQKLPQLPAWPMYFVLALVATIMIASAIAILHQWLIERMTLSLFRLYSMGVLCGIGGTVLLGISFWLTGEEFPLRWLVDLGALLLLPVGGGYAGFRWAKQFRGSRPATLQWITPEEFGSDLS